MGWHLLQGFDDANLSGLGIEGNSATFGRREGGDQRV